MLHDEAIVGFPQSPQLSASCAEGMMVASRLRWQPALTKFPEGVDTLVYVLSCYANLTAHQALEAFGVAEEDMLRPGKTCSWALIRHCHPEQLLTPEPSQGWASCNVGSMLASFGESCQ